MKVSVTVQVGSEKDMAGFYNKDFDSIFTATVEGQSTEEVEKKLGLLQEVATHKGWKIK